MYHFELNGPYRDIYMKGDRDYWIITVPDEKEIIAAMEEIRSNPSNVA